MRTINYYCDCCGEKLSMTNYYESKVTMTLDVKTNSDSEPQQQDRNKSKEYHYCSKCYDNYIKSILFVLSNMNTCKEELEILSGSIIKYRK